MPGNQSNRSKQFLNNVSPGRTQPLITNIVSQAAPNSLSPLPKSSLGVIVETRDSSFALAKPPSLFDVNPFSYRTKLLQDETTTEVFSNKASDSGAKMKIKVNRLSKRLTSRSVKKASNDI